MADQDKVTKAIKRNPPPLYEGNLVANSMSPSYAILKHHTTKLREMSWFHEELEIFIQILERCKSVYKAKILYRKHCAETKGKKARRYIAFSEFIAREAVREMGLLGKTTYVAKSLWEDLEEILDIDMTLARKHSITKPAKDTIKLMGDFIKHTESGTKVNVKVDNSTTVDNRSVTVQQGVYNKDEILEKVKSLSPELKQALSKHLLGVKPNEAINSVTTLKGIKNQDKEIIEMKNE
jgi:hypothetical protein